MEGTTTRQRGISREALDLCAGADIVDAHIESFVWTRVFGYDVRSRHGPGLLGGCLYSQLDVPRMLDAGMTGGVFSIATNPLRRRRRRTETLLANVARLGTILDADGRVAVVADHAGYRRAREGGRLACFVAIQGGNALDTTADDVERVPDVVSRITLVHLSRSTLGSPSAPLGGTGGLSDFGADYVGAMNGRRILVDLAHIGRRGFWDALAVHDPGQPAVVSHTGAYGAHPSWRNVDDDQIRAIAELGGVVGIMFHAAFLGEPLWRGRAEGVVRHLQHVIRVGGEDAAAIGSDWDGLIVPPADLRTVDRLPLLAHRMLERGFSGERIHKVLGANYLRVVAELRPGQPGQPGKPRQPGQPGPAAGAPVGAG